MMWSRGCFGSVKLQTQDPGMNCKPGAPSASLPSRRSEDFAFGSGVIEKELIAARATRPNEVAPCPGRRDQRETTNRRPRYELQTWGTSALFWARRSGDFAFPWERRN
jgi:hypothetical protein